MRLRLAPPPDPDQRATKPASVTATRRDLRCLHRQPDSHGWNDVADLELATLSWVQWFNEQRLHSHCGDVPPAEFELAFCAALQADPAGV